MTLINADVKAELTAAADAYHAAIPGSPAASYLGQRFGSEYARIVADAYTLGYVATPFVPTHKRFTGRLTIPYLTSTGVIGLKVRCLRCPTKCEGHSKYDGPAGLGVHLYNTAALLDPMSDTLVVCEGEIDAMTMDAIVGVPAVAVPGVSSWQNNQHWRHLIRTYANVLVVWDGDDAGRGAAGQIAASLQTPECNAHVIDMPDGEDINSYTRKHGPDAMRTLLNLKE